MRPWLILCLGFTCLPLSPPCLADKKDPKFKLSFRSSLKVTGGSVSSGVAWGEELVASSESSDEVQSETDGSSDVQVEPFNTLAPRKRDGTPSFRYIKKKGRITVQMSHKTTIQETKSNGTLIDSNPNKVSSQPDTFSISVDPFAALRLFGIFGLTCRHIFVAFVGTLKLLGPLIFARRVLAQVGELGTDYMMGRYLRTTYERVERKYWKEYQGPAACRSFGRCFAHTIALLLLGRFMDWMVGLKYPPCVISPKAEGHLSCHWWCGLLWVIAVIGAGNFIAALFATRGPLRIKVTKSSLSKPKKRRRVLFRPLKYLSWMKDPDKWIADIATNRRDNAKSWKPFTPEPLLFPSTWPPFSMLRNFAVAKAMASSSDIAAHDSMHVIMRQFLIQQAILDEWHRVLMDERRVGLGICAIAVGFTASCFLFVSVAYADGIAAVLMVPSLLATFSSAWMNLFVFYERRRDRASRQNLIVLKHRKRLGSTSYSIKW